MTACDIFPVFCVYLLRIASYPVLTSTIEEQREMSTEILLRNQLLINYDYYVRPVRSPKSTVEVKYESSIYQLVGINTKDQTIKMLMFQRLSWTDELLKELFPPPT